MGLGGFGATNDYIDVNYRLKGGGSANGAGEIFSLKKGHGNSVALFLFLIFKQAIHYSWLQLTISKTIYRDVL